MICFCHMVKVAGTTLHYVFRNNYGINYVEFLDIPRLQDQVIFLRNLKKLQPNLMGIGGHPCRANREFFEIDHQIKYFTFLREPVQRWYSFYNGQLKLGVHSCSIKQRSRCVHLQDYLTKFILGYQSWEDRSFVADKNDLKEAMRILRDDYQFVGLVEHFDESLLMMKQILNLGDFDPRYERKNVKNSRQERNSLSETDIAFIKDANRLDMELYKYVTETIWPNQLDAYNGNLVEDIEDFRNSNEEFRFNKMNLFLYRLVKHSMHKQLSKYVSSRSRTSH